jgi:GNAT superfamily N-acetyltransferase
VIDAIYVFPESQGQGIGTMLLAQALKNLKEWTVDVEAGNKTGIRFYKAREFQAVEEYKEPFFGYDLKTIRMTTDILI